LLKITKNFAKICKNSLKIIDLYIYNKNNTKLDQEKLDIVKLINNSPIQSLSNEFQTKLISKIKDSFTDDQQQLFVASFYSYLNYNSKTDFVIKLEDVWKWCGFSRKDPAKRLLEKFFSKDIDYKIVFFNKDETIKPAPPKCGAGSSTRTRNLGGAGYNKETIVMTINTFKKFCLKAGTKKADSIHDYYLKLEELLHDTMKEESENMKKELEEIEAQNKFLEIELQDKTKQINVLTKKTNKFEKGESVYIFRSSYDNKNIYKVDRTKNCNEREYTHKTATFDGEIVYQAMCCNSTILEKVIHFLLDKYKLATRREWFTIDLNIIKNTIDYAKLVLESNIDLEKSNIVELTNNFIKGLKKIEYESNKENNELIKTPFHFTILELKNYINNPDDFNKFIIDCCEINPDYSVSYKDLKNQYKIWSKTANHQQLKNMIEYLKLTYTTTMKKANPLVSTSKLTGFFNGLKIKKELYFFEDPKSDNLIIEKYLNEHCQRAPGYRITINELYDHFENFCQDIGVEFSYYIKEQIKNYFDIVFVRLRKGISNSEQDCRLGGWLGVSLKNNEQPEPILNYKPKNRKVIKALHILTHDLIKEWPSVTDASIELQKSRPIVSQIIKRHSPIDINNNPCYLSY
jgi:hypothetical protein